MFAIISLLSKKSLRDLLSFALYYHTKKCYLWLRIFFLLDSLQILLFGDNVYDYHPIVAKSKLLLNPLFPTLKKGIIQLFIVSLHKVPEFWCSFFSNTKLLIFGNFYFIIKISLNSFIT